jgi:transcriptional regulator with XRE-family HTH domain
MKLVETWPQYVRRISRSLKQEEISEMTGISQTTVSAWLRGAPAMPKAESVIIFAKAFGQPPVEALVAAGYLDSADVASTVRTPLSEYSSTELFDELRARTQD